MLKLVFNGTITIQQGIAALTQKPAQILGLERGALTAGFSADICVFDPNQEWSVNSENWLSKGVNTPFWGKSFRGRVTHTLQAGKVIYLQENNRPRRAAGC